MKQELNFNLTQREVYLIKMALTNVPEYTSEIDELFGKIQDLEEWDNEN